jgi:hypothetical protein
VESSIGQVKGPCYLNRDDHVCNIWARKKKTDIGRCSFVNRTIILWNRLSAEALSTFPCTSHIFRKGVKKARSEGVLKRGEETSKSAGK